MRKSKYLVLIGVLILILPAIINFVNFKDNSESIVSPEEKQGALNIDSKKPITAGLTYGDLWIDDSGVSPNSNGTWESLEGEPWLTDVYNDNSLYLIEDITLSNPDNTGSPLLIGNSSVDFIIRNCTFLNSGAGGAGIRFRSVNNGKIYDCNISNNWDGIYLDGGSKDNIFKNNTIANSLRSGIQVYINSDNNDVINNTITTYNSYGVILSGADGFIIENNTIDGGKGGVIMLGSENVVVRNNTITDGSSYGINARNTLNLKLSGNTMQECGILWSEYNELNRFRSTTIYLNNTVNGKPVYFYKDEIGLNSNNFTHAGNPGQIILANCSYSDISNFNLSDASVGITLGWSEHNMISNNIVNDGFYGISLQYFSHNNTIFNNTVKDNYFGIYLYNDCDENNITKNIGDNNYGLQFSAGIRLYYSDYCNITNNLLTSNEYGILLQYSTDCIIFNNTAKDNNDYGIFLRMRCTNNLILNNTAYETLAGRPQLGGLYLYDKAERNNITNNDFSNNINYGIRLFTNSHNNTIINNNLSFSDMYGVYLDSSYDNTFTNNEINNNKQYGIYLDNSNNTRVIKNEIKNNDLHGMFISSSNNSYIFDNNITNNGQTGNYNGIYLDNAHWNNITGNRISNNTDDGIEVFQSNFNPIIGNIANYNGDAGIYLRDSNYNSIYDNTAKNNTYGLRLEDSNYNCISGNTLVNNTYNYNETGTCVGNRDCRVASPTYPPAVGDDDDDDDKADDTGVLVVVVVVIVIASVAAGVGVIYVLIKKGFIGTAKSR